MCSKELGSKIRGSARANLNFSPQISIKLATVTGYAFGLQHQPNFFGKHIYDVCSDYCGFGINSVNLPYIKGSAGKGPVQMHILLLSLVIIKDSFLPCEATALYQQVAVGN
jgi:hypothetical protein